MCFIDRMIRVKSLTLDFIFRKDSTGIRSISEYNYSGNDVNSIPQRTKKIGEIGRSSTGNFHSLAHFDSEALHNTQRKGMHFSSDVLYP